MLWLTIAGLTVLAAVIVLVELLTAAGWMAAAATVEQVDRQADDDEPYEGKHRAPDPEAVTIPIERAAYWPPEADLIRPYAAVGGPR